MGMSDYYRRLRARTGNALLLLPGVAAVVRNAEGQVLVHRNQYGQWSLPAGTIEPTESPARAVIRELYEETGLRARPTRILGVVGGPGCRVTYPNGDRVEYVVTVFECRVVGGTLTPHGDETTALAWFDREQLKQLAFGYPEALLFGNDAGGSFDWDDDWLTQLD